MKTQGLRMGRWITLFLNFLFIFKGLNQAQAHPIVEYWENKTGTGLGPIFDPRVSFFNTSSNYGSDSKSNPIPNGVSVNQDYIDLNLTWGMTEDWFLFGRLSLLSENISFPGQAGLSNFGLSDQLLGTTYRVYKKNGFSIDLQFDAVIPTYSNSSAQQDSKAYLGDGSDDLTLGVLRDSHWGSQVSPIYFSRAVSATPIAQTDSQPQFQSVFFLETIRLMPVLSFMRES